MPLLIGMDEAGLGPNLGPFVVAATVWEVPGPPEEFDFWSVFDSVVTSTPRSRDPRLHIADSKQVFQPHKGLKGLERGVWSALSLCGIRAATYADLCRGLQRTVQPTPVPVAMGAGRSLFDCESEEVSDSDSVCPLDEDHAGLPWYIGCGHSIPEHPPEESIVTAWQQACSAAGVRLIAIGADVVEPRRLNRLMRRFDNKSQATSRLAMNLLRGLWDPAQPALIVADKHGGRNRYDLLLRNAFGSVERVVEGATCSAYRVGRGTIRFEPRAESQGPVALASMVAKYLRELAMTQFNRFWLDRIPGLKPTQGYPLDARRFQCAIAEEQKRLGIESDCLWRDR